MKFAELNKAAQSLAPEQVDASLRELMRDPRFAAVVRLLSDYREELMVRGGAPNVAANPSASTIMAHYFGGVDILLALETRLSGICEEAERQRAS
jgi:hypothetical protein